jgi:hypothetical protein
VEKKQAKRRSGSCDTRPSEQRPGCERLGAATASRDRVVGQRP